MMRGTGAGEATDDTTVAACSRPLRRDAARNRQLLLDAARVVFGDRGLDASLDDVAREAGVGVGTAYRHFANKHELAEAVFAQQIDRMIERAEHAADCDDPWQGITDFVTGAAAAQIEDRGLREVLTSVHDEDRFDEISARFDEPLNRLVERARRAGAIRPDVEPCDLAIAMMMLCSVADFAGPGNQTLWRRYVPMLLQGLTPGVSVTEPPMSDQAFRDALKADKRTRAVILRTVE